VLAIEYDVTEQGEIQLIALINATEENGEDADGAEWLAWRRSMEDGGMGCAPVPVDDLKLMETTENPEQLCAIVERIVLADRGSKETR
jgi:hypothetical protein